MIGLFRNILVFSLLASTTGFSYAADGIALGARAPGTTLISIDGIDTSKATITAVLTRADYEECNEIGGQACGTGDMVPNQKFVINADCEIGTVIDIDGERYRRTGDWAQNENGAGFFEGRPKFVGPDGDLAYASNAYNGGRLAIAYERLCPNAAEMSVVTTTTSTSEAADIMDPTKLDGRIIWDHNGSDMLIDADKGVIVYDRPKPSIAKTVKPGQVLFRGNIDPMGAVSGTAYTFKRGCTPAPYAVKGRWNDEGVLTLTGAAPKRSKTGCAVDGRTSASAHSTLDFKFLFSP